MMQGLKIYVKQHLPAGVVNRLTSAREKYLAAQKRRLPNLSQDTLRNIITNELELERGGVVFVHSSIDALHLPFPFFQVLQILRGVVGEEGTLMFPTYPKGTSYAFLNSDNIFDVRKTPSNTGILTEFARRQRKAIRSLHPTKSVCAIGPRAELLIQDHHKSPFPFDSCSPYYKLIEERRARIIGLGVATRYLSFVHCVDDALKDQFPVQAYHEKIFHAKCIDYAGNLKIVDTFAHDMRRMNHDIPSFVRRHIPGTICKELTIVGRKFYTAKADALFDLMLDLAKKKITIYPKRSWR